MNSRYNIGKVLYKVDSYIDRSQETIYTQNIISDNQIVKDELTIGEGSDDSIVKISQSTNPLTDELEGNIETPNIKITKELKFEGDNNTTIDNSGINADTIYVNNLYTDNYNPTNLKTQNIVIVDEHDQETGTKITKDGIEANTIKAQNLDVEGLNINELTFKNEQETITTTINKDGITINNTNNNKSIGLNSDGELYFNNKKVNDIKQATTISNKDNLLTTQGYVDEAINEAIIGGLDNIEVNVIKSKTSDHSIDVYADLVLKDNNDVKYDVIAGNIIGTYKSEYSDNPNVLIDNSGITLKDKKITDIDKLDTETENITIPTTAKVEKLISDIDLTNYVKKSDSSELTFSNPNNSFNGSLTTSSIIINNKKSITDTTAVDSTHATDSILATQYYVDSKQIDLSNYDKLVKITNDSNEITAKKLIMEKINESNEKITIENITSLNNSDKTLATKEYNDNTYASKSGDNTFTGNNTFSTGQVIFNNGLSTASSNPKVSINNSGITLDNKDLISVINKENDNTDDNKKLYTVKKIDALLDVKANISDIPDVSDFITKDVDNLTNYTTTSNADNKYVLKTGTNTISSNNTFSGTNTFTTNAINANSGITTSSGDLSLTSTSGNINFGSNTTLTNSSNVETFTTNNLIGNYKSNSTNPSVSITNNTATNGVVLDIENNNTSTLSITNSGKIIATELNTNTINGNNSSTMNIKPLTTNSTNTSAILNLNNNSNITSNYSDGITLDTLTTDNFNVSNVDISNILKTNTINNHDGTELTITPINSSSATQDTEYKLNLGFNTTITSVKTQEGGETKLEDTIKSDNLLIDQIIIGEITTIDDGIYSTAKIESGTKDNDDKLHPKTGLYNSGDIKANNSIVLKAGNDLNTNTNDLVKIEKSIDTSDNEYGKISILNPSDNTKNIVIDAQDGSINQVKTSNLIMSNKTINNISADIVGSTGSNTTLATEAYVLAQTSGTITTENINAKTITLNYDNTASPSPSAEQIKVKNSSDETIFLVNGQTKETIINGTITNSSGDLNINPTDNVNIQKPIKTLYSIEDSNIIKLYNNTYKGITYDFSDTTNYYAKITNINMNNEQCIIIPRHIIYNNNYYKIKEFNNNFTLSNIQINGYIYIPDTIDTGLNYLLSNNTLTLNIPINLYCNYLLNLSTSQSFTNLTIILRENKQNIYNINNNEKITEAFIINLSSIKSIYLETDKTKITTLFNEYASFYPDKFKNMPSEHYDILSNLEKYINDKLIKESNKKMVYLKNGFTKTMTTLPLNTSADAITYNPYYKETLKTGQRQIFNTELNNVIINTGNEFKYKYNFQDDNNYTTIDLTGITNIDYEFQHSFVMNETLYNVNRDLSNNIISIKSLWSFNQNIKLNEVYTTDITLGANYYSLYVYPYIIIYGINNNEKVLFYSNNLLYWQKIILDTNISENLYYVNDKFNKLLINDINFTLENTLIIHKITDDYYIYPSYTKEELFMRM